MQSKPSSNTITPVILLMLLLLGTLAHVTADMYIPSLPAMTKALNTSNSTIQLTFSLYIFGFSVSHLIYGPIADHIGRRIPLLSGLFLSMLGSICCYLAPTAGIVIVGRLLQGMGVGACSSIGRSLARDLLSGEKLAKVGSQLGMVTGFVIAGAPIVGGYLQHYFSWRANFFFLIVYTGLIWLFIWKKLPETHQYFNKSATQLHVMMSNYILLLSNRTFLGFTLCAGIAYGGMIGYLVTTPFLLQNIVGLNPVQFGWLAFLEAVAIFISSYFNNRYIIKVGIPKMMKLGALLMLSGGLLMLLPALMGYINTYVIMLPVAIFCIGAGLTFTNAFAGAFQPFPKIAGTAGALYGFLQILCGSLASAIMSTMHVKNQFPLAIFFATLGLLSFLSLKYLSEPSKKEFEV